MSEQDELEAYNEQRQREWERDEQAKDAAQYDYEQRLADLEAENAELRLNYAKCESERQRLEAERDRLQHELKLAKEAYVLSSDIAGAGATEVQRLQKENAELEERFESAHGQKLSKEIHSNGRTAPRLGTPIYMYSGPRNLALSVGMLELKKDELQQQLHEERASYEAEVGWLTARNAELIQVIERITKQADTELAEAEGSYSCEISVSAIYAARRAIADSGTQP